MDRDAFSVAIVDTNRSSEGVLQITLVLSNGSPRACSVASDITGSPALVLEVPGRTRWLIHPAQGSALSIGPTSNLATVAWVTNPPSRFRLNFSIRRAQAEQGVAMVRRFLPRWTRSDFTEWTRQVWNPANPASAWIE
jgi:hypothetical protein